MSRRRTATTRETSRETSLSPASLWRQRRGEGQPEGQPEGPPEQPPTVRFRDDGPGPSSFDYEACCLAEYDDPEWWV